MSRVVRRRLTAQPWTILHEEHEEKDPGASAPGEREQLGLALPARVSDNESKTKGGQGRPT